MRNKTEILVTKWRDITQTCYASVRPDHDAQQECGLEG